MKVVRAIKKYEPTRDEILEGKLILNRPLLPFDVGDMIALLKTDKNWSAG
eukprot:Awhi_evm1s10753